MAQQPPLTGIRVLEFAGLAPGPYAGLLLADYGAEVLRIDRAHPKAHTDTPPPPTPDALTRHKRSIAVNTKTPAGLALIKSLIPHVDVVIDPFRPGVLEKLGLSPDAVLLPLNPRVIVARMTGFRRDGKYRDMAGHDINYLAVSGVLSMLGRAGEAPYAPGNLLGDFGGGGAVCFMGILLALLHRERHGRGQVVEANMVDGAAHLATMPRFARHTPMWNAPRGHNVLDGACPYYGTYETRDGKYVAVGALEPQFYARLMKGLDIDPARWKNRDDKRTWGEQREVLTGLFKQRTRSEWERVFDGTDACVTPVLEQSELQAAGYDQRPIVTLNSTPGLAVSQRKAVMRQPAEGQGVGVAGGGWTTPGLRPGEGGERFLSEWAGWNRNQHYELKNGGLELMAQANARSRL